MSWKNEVMFLFSGQSHQIYSSVSHFYHGIQLILTYRLHRTHHTATIYLRYTKYDSLVRDKCLTVKWNLSAKWVFVLKIQYWCELPRAMWLFWATLNGLIQKHVVLKNIFFPSVGRRYKKESVIELLVRKVRPHSHVAIGLSASRNLSLYWLILLTNSGRSLTKTSQISYSSDRQSW